jgi:hypothetical protein
MEQKDKEQKRNEEQDWQCGCFEPSSRIGKMMMKMMKEMCGSADKNQFDCESMMNKMNCFREAKQ